MTNPFETGTTQTSRHFSISYRNASISVTGADDYCLTWPDGRWIKTACREDFSKAISSSDNDSRHMISCSWTILSTSGGPAWINREQLQVIGELIDRKEAR